MLNKIKFDVLIIIAFSIGVFFIDGLEKNYYKYFYYNFFYNFQNSLLGNNFVKFFENITVLGDSAWYFIFSIFFFLVAYFLKKSNFLKKYNFLLPNIQYYALLLFFSILSSGIIVQLIKHIVGRLRPPSFLLNEFYLPFLSVNSDPSFNIFTLNSSFHSFPSGHTATIFAVALVFSLMISKLKYFFYFSAIIVSVSRVVIGVHFATDVVCGIFVAYVGFKIALLAVSRLFKEKKDFDHNFVLTNNFIVIMLALTIISMMLVVGPSFDIFFNSLFFLGHIAGVGYNFILQGNDFITILFRKIILGTIIVYVFILPIFSFLVPLKKIYFNFSFKIKDIFFIWSSAIFSMVVVVNVVLKNMWGRARPNDILEFGGSDIFTPWYKLSHACITNCSFVSGDAAVGFSLVALYFLIKKEAYLWLAVFFGFALGLIRIMEGAHFFSDVILSCFVVFIFTYLFYSLFTNSFKKTNIFLVIFCLLFLLLKFLAVSSTSFNLYGDEAQYWLWSKELAFGYYSKPPLLAWLISAATVFFGNSFLTLKSIPIVLYCVTSLLIFILSSKLFKNNTLALCCGLTFFLLPATSLSSFLLSTDIILILFWAGSLIQILRIRECPTYYNFVFLGVLVGLAFLSKYAAVYFIISLALLIIIDKDFRHIFLMSKFKLVLFVIVTSLIVFPNALWNHYNNWATLEHTADNASIGSLKFNLVGFSEFFLSQILLIGPFLFVSFLFCNFKKIKIGTNERFLFAFALPALLIVSFESILVRAHANWAAVSLVSLSILLVSIVYQSNEKLVHLNNYLNLTIGFALFIMIGTNYPLAAFDRISGLRDFSLYLGEKNNSNIKNIVVSDRLLYASLNYSYKGEEIKFFAPHNPGSKISNHFQLKNALPKNFTANFILIGHQDDVSYLQNINYLKKNNKIKLLGSTVVPFSKEKLFVYEVLFDEIVSF